MKKYLFLIILALASCTEEHELCQNTETSSETKTGESLDSGEGIRGEFVSSMWGVRVTNEGEEQIMLGTNFYSVQVFSESGEHVGASVLGSLGGEQTYRLTPQGRERFIEFGDHLRGATGLFVCKVFYLDDLGGELKTLEFNFHVRE